METQLRARFVPVHFVLTDQSGQHAGHAGARPGGETHYHLAMYAVFVDWPRVLAWFRKRRLLRGPTSWWRRFCMVPERFPGVRVTGLGDKGVLLWDGDCGFCARMVGRLKQFSRSPFAERPYQTVAAQLPQQVRRWNNCQAHWIDERGEVTGGSAALIELLDASGRRMLASFLDTAICRPLLWFGYRVVARNRGLWP